MTATVDPQLAGELCRIARRMDARGYVGATDGNVSARIDDGRFVISRSGVAFGDLDPRDLVLVDASGSPLNDGAPRPSSEFRMHVAIYRARPDVHAIAHAHPPTAIALTISPKGWVDGVLPEVVVGLGTVPVVPYTTPTTDETAEAAAKALTDRDAIILAHHGVVAVSTDPTTAFHKLDKVEHSARILYLAHTLGGVRTLDDDALARLADL